MSNRSERRRAERAANKTATYTLTQKQLDDIKLEAKRVGAEEAFAYTLCVPALAARDEFGFGKSRMNKLVNKTIELFSYYEDGYFTIEDLREVVKDEIDITFTEELSLDRVRI